MAFDFAAAILKSRRVLHDTFKVAVDYTAAAGGEAVRLHVRWHNKVERFGELLDGGYAEVIEGIDSLVFDAAELAEQGVTLERGGAVQIAAAGWPNTVMFLKTQNPQIGPIEVVWRVGLEK